jgi:hypothetical protein
MEQVCKYTPLSYQYKFVSVYVLMVSGHLVEDFSSPTHLCGVCLRKLQFRLGFDVRGRYQRLGAFYRSVNMLKETKWIEQRLQTLREVLGDDDGVAIGAPGIEEDSDVPRDDNDGGVTVDPDAVAIEVVDLTSPV